MPTSHLRILVVEDDARVRRELLDALRAAGYDVEVAVSAEDGGRALRRAYDLVLLDLGLPDGDGLDLLRDLRARGQGVPVLILTARDTPELRVRGLDVGADDYVVKPFHMPELLARARNLLRRAGRSMGPGPMRLGELWADPEARTAGRGDAPIELKPRELDLLLFLLRHPDRTWTREQLLDRVWGPDYVGDTRTVDTHVARLRAQVEVDDGDPRFIETVWGVGYRMKEPE